MKLATNNVRTIFAALISSALAAACSESQTPAAPAAPPPPPVTVAKPVRQTVVDHDEYVGRFIAVDAVEVRARVSGYLESVHFTDGQIVKQGDLLFTIDRRPFQNALDQANANLNQAKANVAFAAADLERAQQLVRERTISTQVFEQRVQASRTATAAAAAAEAAVRQASLELEFTELRAPVAGRIGDRRVSPGNLVAGGAGAGATTLLTTIVSTDPIRFEFTFDEAAYLRYVRLAERGGQDIASRGKTTPVALMLIDEKAFGHKGEMDFLNNVIDSSTGTIRGRAQFKNPGVFTPGMFGRIQVPGSSPYEALTVPDVAIASEQVRKIVYVVGDDNIPKPKYVTLGPVVDGRRVIREGVEPDDWVVINGLMRIRPGQPVTPQREEKPAAGPAASATK
jgi:multidrug efflux system membrane fusion protein